MSLWVSVKDRQFTFPLSTAQVELDVENYSFMEIGGPDQASISASGTVSDLWELIEWLRCPIEILDEQHDAVWWGYVSEIEISIGALTVGVSIDSMHNRVRVLYSLATTGAGGSKKATTAWIEDADSVGTYGIKEKQGSFGDATPEMADAIRNTALAVEKYPTPVVTKGERGQVRATIRCRGWWHTIDWQHYEQPAGIEEYAPEAPVYEAQDIGGLPSNLRVAQRFVVNGTEPWTAKTLTVALKRVGTPTDTLTVDICSDAAGSPGSAIASLVLQPADVPAPEGDKWEDVEIALPLPVLQAGAAYWIVLTKSGASNVHRYQVRVDTSLTFDQALRIWNGSQWVQRNPDAQMPFRLAGVQETTEQIATIVRTACQFITATDILDPSGVESSPYRNGDNTALSEIEALLSTGTTTGQRLLATITRDRRLVVYAEPTSVAHQDWSVNSDGELRNAYDQPVARHTCPVAVWVRLRDVIPATADVSRLANPAPFFIQRSEYQVASDDLSWEPRGVESAWDIGRIQMG